MGKKVFSVLDVQKATRVTIKKSKMSDATFAQSIDTTAAELCRFLKDKDPKFAPMKIVKALGLKKKILPVKYEDE